MFNKFRRNPPCRVMRGRIGGPGEKGQKLLVLEAMKMEQQLLAPFDGVAKTFNATPDAQIAEGVVFAFIEREEQKIGRQAF